MSDSYAEVDWEVVDYQMYCLDPEVINRHTNKELLLRGPKPQKLEKDKYIVCIGAAQTFGRFCEKPFPTLLHEEYGYPTLNLGYGGAGPSFFCKDNDKLMDKYVNNSKFVVIQVMSGRSESNSLFKSKGLGRYTRIIDGKSIGCKDAFKELLEENNEDFLKKIVAETRDNWIENYKQLLEQIKVPKILLWFSIRRPRYREDYKSKKVNKLFGGYPQLVNSKMVNQIRMYCDKYVECRSRRGTNHLLVSRFTGEPTTIVEKWSGNQKFTTSNTYYPSPEMHIDAANVLKKVCKSYI